MPTDASLYRPVPRHVRVLALLTVLCATALLVLGALVTTLGAGMTDEQWPTSPTHMAEHPEILRGHNTGLKVEHSHRILGFLTGGFASLLALAAWRTEPNRAVRWAGLVAVLMTLVAYGQFHRGMGEAWELRKAGGGLAWPKGAAVATSLAAAGLLAAAAVTAAGARRGWAVRLFASVGLLAVMVQGLLGGFRVFLDHLTGLHHRLGVELAAVHGTVAQLVFCVLVVVVVLTAPRRLGDTAPGGYRAGVGVLAILLVVVLLKQLAWGVWLRHVGSPVAQRLHVLTAFAATGLCVWVCVRALSTADGRRHIGFLAYHLLGILLLQVALGVEAWMGKFAAAGPQAAVPPQLRAVTPDAAGIRTAHVLIGTALLAAAVVFAMRVWRKPVAVPAEDAAERADRQVVEPAAAV